MIQHTDSMKPAKTGPFGILVRLLLLTAILFGLYQIIFDWPSKMTDTSIIDVGFWVTAGFTVLLFSDVLNLTFRRNWGYRPIQVLIALAVVALVADLIVYEEAWEAPLAWLVWGAALFVYGFLTVSFLVGIAMRLQGCELSALPVMAARRRGRPDYEPSPCILGLHKIDEWEDRRRAVQRADRPNALGRPQPKPRRPV